MSGLTSFSSIHVQARGITFRVYDSAEVVTTTSATATTHIYDHVLILLHGCGGTSQTFGAMVTSFPKSIRVIAFDCRGHGGTTTDVAEDEKDLSLDTLVTDGKELLSTILHGKDQPFVLCGHSMGGAVAVRLASQFTLQCKGIIVLDAVEGVALNSLEAGELRTAQIPQRFRTKEDAVKYAMSSSHNGHFSASISVPDQLVDHADGGYTWRTDVLATAKYWREWFSGLSESFLSLSCPKLLMLAGVDNLDTPLAAGHMQGKYQLVVLANVHAGHFVQEDAPGQTATVILTFLSRLRAREAAAASKPGGLSAKDVIALNAKIKRGET